VPVAPVRAFDSRPYGDPFLWWAPGQQTALSLDAFVPAGTTVVMTLTGTETVIPGYVTAWPWGSDRPFTSVLNLTRPGHTRANTATVRLGTSSMIGLFASGQLHLIGDIQGYYTP